MNGVSHAVSVAARPEPRQTVLRRVWRGLGRQPVALAAGFLLMLIFVVGALVPFFAPRIALIDLSDAWRNHPPVLSGWHLFGTDALGRDMLVRTLQGLHTSEESALGATVVATALGVVLGGLAGYRGGWLDALVMRITDMLGVFPLLMIFLIAYMYFAPIDDLKATFVIGCFLWIPVARVVRVEVASLRAREFVQAALSLGASDGRIFVRHVLPNATGTIVVAATTLFAQVIVIQATLEFFGLGVSEAIQSTLGNLIGDGQRNVFALGAGWWTWASPTAVLLLILVCANLLGDGFADALRPGET